MTGDKLSDVPNTPGTPRRSIRVPEPLWEEAQELTRLLGLNVSDELRKNLERDVKRWRKQVERLRNEGKL